MDQPQIAHYSSSYLDTPLFCWHGQCIPSLVIDSSLYIDTLIHTSADVCGLSTCAYLYNQFFCQALTFCELYVYTFQNAYFYTTVLFFLFSFFKLVQHKIYDLIFLNMHLNTFPPIF